MMSSADSPRLQRNMDTPMTPIQIQQSRFRHFFPHSAEDDRSPTTYDVFGSASGSEAVQTAHYHLVDAVGLNSCNTGNDRAPRNYDFLGSAALLSGSEPMQVTPHRLPDPIAFRLRSQEEEQEIDTAISMQHIPSGLLTESPELRATLLHSQRTVVPTYTHQLDPNAPPYISAINRPDHARDIPPFPGFNDESSSIAVQQYRSSVLVHHDDQALGRDAMWTSLLMPRPFRACNMRTGESEQWLYSNIPRVEEHAYANWSQILLQQNVLDVPKTWPHFDAEVSNYGNANPQVQVNPYNQGPDSNYIPRACNRYYGHPNQSYPIQNQSHPIQNQSYPVQNQSYPVQNQSYRSQNIDHSIQNPYNKAPNPYQGTHNNFHKGGNAFNDYQGAAVGSRHEMIMPRENMVATQGQNITTIVGANERFSSSLMQADGRHLHNNILAARMTQHQYGNMKIDEMTRQQGVPVPQSQRTNSFLHAPQPTLGPMGNTGSNYYGTVAQPRLPSPAVQQTFGRRQAGSKQNMLGGSNRGKNNKCKSRRGG